MKKILLLEDENNLNRGISLKLRKEGYQVLSASTIWEAKRVLEKEMIDLVISDIMLPDGSGLDFGKEVREKSNALLIYLLENAGQVLSKERILERVWGLEGQFVDDNTVIVNISRLKNKLGTDCIANVRGLGYVWKKAVSKK